MASSSASSSMEILKASLVISSTSRKRIAPSLFIAPPLSKRCERFTTPLRWRTNLEAIEGFGIAAFGEMDADLVFASGFKPHFDERGSWISLHDANVRDRQFSSSGFSGGINTICGILGQMRSDREVVRHHPAFHDGDVSTAGAVVFEL